MGKALVIVWRWADENKKEQFNREYPAGAFTGFVTNDACSRLGVKPEDHTLVLYEHQSPLGYDPSSGECTGKVSDYVKMTRIGEVATFILKPSRVQFDNPSVDVNYALRLANDTLAMIAKLDQEAELKKQEEKGNIYTLFGSTNEPFREDDDLFKPIYSNGGNKDPSFKSSR